MKVHSERLGPGAFFCVESNPPRCLIKKLKAKQKSGPIFYKINPISQPLHMGANILKIPLAGLVPKSFTICMLEKM